MMYKKKGYKRQLECESCGEMYLGGSRSKYCYECGDIIRNERENRYSKKRYEKKTQFNLMP